MQFDIKLKSQDMYRFNMYQTYTGFHGWFSIIVSIIIFYCGGLNIWWTRHYLYGFVYCVWHYFPLYMPGHAVAAFQECTCSIGSAA